MKKKRWLRGARDIASRAVLIPDGGARCEKKEVVTRRAAPPAARGRGGARCEKKRWLRFARRHRLALRRLRRRGAGEEERARTRRREERLGEEERAGERARPHAPRPPGGARGARGRFGCGGYVREKTGEGRAGGRRCTVCPPDAAPQSLKVCRSVRMCRGASGLDRPDSSPRALAQLAEAVRLCGGPAASDGGPGRGVGPVCVWAWDVKPPRPRVGDLVICACR